MPDEDKYPSDILIEDINRFVQDMTSLYITLPSLMYTTETLIDEKKKIMRLF